ncbi:MAG: thiolase family protein [Chloroflexi bacterium]|nr:thiolase family protein [Chloroflexota bacterium]
MTLRGKTAIVGISEVPTSRRSPPGRTTFQLLAEVADMAIKDAGLRKEDIDGLITHEGSSPLNFAEYIGLRPAHCQGMVQHGASGATSIVTAAAAIDAGLCNYVLCAFGFVGEVARRATLPDSAPAASLGSEFEAPYGPVIAANGGYGLIKTRHMYEFGTTQRQFAKIAVDERFNALTNPNSVFQGQPITIDDVLNSRFINDPLHILESVMPCDGGGAVIVTSAERAKALPHRPVYLLGAGAGATTHMNIWQNPRMVNTPVRLSAPRAFRMAGYAPKDMQFAEFYD